jgi:hypothetical protein
VTITSMAVPGKSDDDIMTVTQGAGGTVLFTFGAGITTDKSGPNSDGLIAAQHGADVTLAAQPVLVTTVSGDVGGSVTGSGKLNGDGSCALTLQFTPGGGMPIEYDIAGNLM